MRGLKELVAIAAMFVLLVSASGCLSQDAENAPAGGGSLPIDSRSFYIGVVPTPRSVPETTFDDVNDAYREAGEIGEVTMVWTGTNIGQSGKLKSSRVVTAVRVYGLRPVLTLGFATIKEVPGSGLKYVVDAPEGVNADLSDQEFRQLWVDEAREIAGEFKPEYISLGNEINDYFHLHPDDLVHYLSLLEEAYSAVKEASPGTKVMVVLSFTHLIDNGQWELLETFGGKVDMIGLTTYPWKHYEKPGMIPTDYYARIMDYVDVPVAFTEIGWPSGSEKDQAEFLVKFLELTEGMDLEMVNWLFLHEVELTGIVGSVTDPETATISLKKADGTKKAVYDRWLELKALPVKR